MHTLSRQAVAAIASRHRSLVAAALALMLFTTLVANGVAHAQPVGGFFVGGAPASTYTGPGDIVPNAAMWWGLRAYNKAFAVASSAAINVERASDSTTEDIHVLSSGALDIASAMAFAGTDAVCTGTISSTTLSITSCASGTLHVNDPISGAGVSPGTIISSIGTCGSGSGTCTLNIPSTVSSSETVTATVALSIMKFYDQTGSGNTQNAIQFSSAFQLVPNCLGALPCGVAVGRINTGYLATITAINQPLTLSYVAERTGTFTSASVAISTFQSGSQIVDQWNSTAKSPQSHRSRRREKRTSRLLVGENARRRVNMAA